MLFNIENAGTRRLIGALRLSLAITVSLTVAMWLNLRNPYWAPLAVMIVDGLHYGSLLERMFQRLAGNFAGAATGIAVISVFAQTGNMYAVVCGCVVTLGTYAFLEFRKPLFWRWAVTAAVIVLTYRIDEPVKSFLLAVDRVSCMGVGIVTIAIFHQVFFPRFAGDDYKSKLETIPRMLASMVKKRAGRLRKSDITPSASPAGIFREMYVLQESLRLARHDTESIHKKGHLHENLVNLMDDLAADITLICMELPPATMATDATALSNLSMNLERLSTDLEGLNRNLKHFFLGEPVSSGNRPGYSQQPDSENYPWQGVIGLARERMVKIYDTIDSFSDTSASCTVKRNGFKRPLRENDLLGGAPFSAWISILAGTAFTCSMVLWRETGWPAGSAMPIFVMILMQLCTAGASLSLGKFTVLLIPPLVIGGFLMTFILPAISSPEFFFMSLFILYGVLGWFIHSPNPAVSSIGNLTALLINCFVNGYHVSALSFTIFIDYLWALSGSVLIAAFFINMFLPSRPRYYYTAHARGFYKKTRKALDSFPSQEAREYLSQSKRHAGHMLQWTRPIAKQVNSREAFHAAMAALSAKCLANALNHHYESGSEPLNLPERNSERELLVLLNNHIKNTGFARAVANPSLEFLNKQVNWSRRIWIR